MKLKSLEEIWLKIIATAETESGIKLKEGTLNGRTDNDKCLAEVVVIGSLLKEEDIHDLKVGDIVIIPGEVKMARGLSLDGEKYVLAKPMHILGYESA